MAALAHVADHLFNRSIVSTIDVHRTSVRDLSDLIELLMPSLKVKAANSLVCEPDLNCACAWIELW